MTETVGGIAAEHLQSFVDRIQRLEEEKKDLTSDIKQVFDESRAMGFDVKILRKLIALLRLPEHERKEQEEILELYKRAVGAQ